MEPDAKQHLMATMKTFLMESAAKLGLECSEDIAGVDPTRLPLEESAQGPALDTLAMCMLSVGLHRVLIGLFELDRLQGCEALENQLTQYHWAAARIRAWLPGVRKDDLLLVLVAPRGASGEPHWEALADRVERDDRICRKQLWLPPLDERAMPASLDGFRKRTFLARPWQDMDSVEPQDLDPRRRLDRLSADQQADRRLPTILDAWLPILTGEIDDDAEEDTGEDVVKRLLAAYPEGPAP